MCAPELRWCSTNCWLACGCWAHEHFTVRGPRKIRCPSLGPVRCDNCSIRLRLDVEKTFCSPRRYLTLHLLWCSNVDLKILPLHETPTSLSSPFLVADRKLHSSPVLCRHECVAEYRQATLRPHQLSAISRATPKTFGGNSSKYQDFSSLQRSPGTSSVKHNYPSSAHFYAKIFPSASSWSAYLLESRGKRSRA